MPFQALITSQNVKNGTWAYKIFFFYNAASVFAEIFGISEATGILPQKSVLKMPFLAPLAEA